MIMWMGRAETGGLLFDSFMDNNLVAIGWNEIGDLANFVDRAELTERILNEWPDYHRQRVGMAAGWT